MKNLKKLSVLLSILILTGCTNFGTRPLKNITEILGMDNSGKESIINEIKFGNKEEEKLSTEEAILTSENTSQYLNELKLNLRSGAKNINSDLRDNYEVYVGEYLITPVERESNARVSNFTKNTNATAKIREDNLYFRTIYRGNYGISIYRGASLIRKINVRAITKYNFSETNIYDIIVENAQKNNKVLEDAISLYKIYYPNGKNIRKVNYILLEYAYRNQDKPMIKEALNGIKSEIANFKDDEKILILRASKFIDREIFIPTSVYRTENPELKKELTTYLKGKEILDKKDIVFLETATEVLNNEEKNNTLKRVTSWYKNNGDISKTNELDKKTAEKKTENFYDIAIKNMNINPRLAIINFKKSLSSEKNAGRRAETYYNIANSYIKLGNKIEAMRYLNLIRQEFSNNIDWVNRSKLLMDTIN